MFPYNNVLLKRYIVDGEVCIFNSFHTTMFFLNSKYYKFIKALKQSKNYIKISEVIGNSYQFKEEIIGSGKYESTLLLPKKFINKEPVELEEIDMVSELLEKIENAKKNEELIDSL